MRPPHEIRRHYDDYMLDIAGAQDIEVLYSPNLFSTLYVNVDGICVLRICKIKGTVEYVTTEV